MDTYRSEEHAHSPEAVPGPQVAHYSTGRLTPAQATVVDWWRARLLEDRPLPGPVLRDVREFLMVTWLSQQAGDNKEAAAEVRKRITALRTGGSKRDWRPY